MWNKCRKLNHSSLAQFYAAGTVIIDNHWRHAEDQPIIFDERGIINNCLTVTVDLCGELTCFCSSFARNLPTSPIAADSDDSLKQVMTPGTVKTFQNSTGLSHGKPNSSIMKTKNREKKRSQTEELYVRLTLNLNVIALFQNYCPCSQWLHLQKFLKKAWHIPTWREMPTTP